MTITTEVRIHWPVPAVALLDHVTRVAGGDPATVARRTHAWWEGSTYTYNDHGVANRAGQGLRTLASVRWSEEPDVGDPDDGDHRPPALVTLDIDNPYGFGPPENTGRWVQAHEILPAVVAWLDEQGVPRDRWWWEDETAGTFHPGTTDVRLLAEQGERETWSPEVASR